MGPIKEFKQTVMIKRPYQCGITVYQLAKLRMLEFYYDFLDKYFSRNDFELCYMDTDSFDLPMSGDSLDEVFRPEMKKANEVDKKNWLTTDKFSEKTSGLFKPEFIGTRGVWLTAKCNLLKMKPEKINISVKVFQKSIMICIFSAINMSGMFF